MKIAPIPFLGIIFLRLPYSPASVPATDNFNDLLPQKKILQLKGLLQRRVWCLIGVIGLMVTPAPGAVVADFAQDPNFRYSETDPSWFFAGGSGIGGWFSLSDMEGKALLKAESAWLADGFAFYLSHYGYELTTNTVPNLTDSWMSNWSPGILNSVSISYNTPHYFAVYTTNLLSGVESFGWFAFNVSPSLQVTLVGSALNEEGLGIRVGTLEAIPEASVAYCFLAGFLPLLLRRKRG